MTSVQQEIIISKQKEWESSFYMGYKKLWKIVRCAEIDIESNEDYDMYRTFLEQSGDVFS